jgi:hypothetical protein
LDSLALKLVLTPALIGMASLAGRRWGPAISGWLVGLPFTSGPIALFLALAHGSIFAAAAAVGTLAGTISQAAFCVTYAWLARYGWPRAVAASCLVFAAATAALRTMPLPLPLALPLVLVGLVAALRLMPGHDRSASAAVGPPPAWDLPARMIVATTFVLLLTAGAPALGPQLTGLLAPFPLYATILAVFAHQQAGAQAATRVLHGLLLGLFAFVGFFATLAALLGQSSVAAAFAAALAAALLIQAGSLWVLRRPANTAPRTR